MLCLLQPGIPRFNEAEARMPRMPRPRQHPRHGGASASMRPRHECLGCLLTLSCPGARTRRFNEAEARMPRMLAGPFIATAGGDALQ